MCLIQTFNRLLVSLPNVPITIDILNLATETNGVLYELVVQFMKRVLVIVSRDLDRNVMVIGQIMYFLVNASPPKPLDLPTSNFAGA